MILFKINFAKNLLNSSKNNDQQTINIVLNFCKYGSFYLHCILLLTVNWKKLFLIIDILVFFDKQNLGTIQRGLNLLSFWNI